MTEESDRQFCTFRVGDLYLGIDVLDVQEVLYEAGVTEVPLAEPHVAGLINLRGQIATSIDLRTRLGLEPRAEDASYIHVVVSERGEPASLQVDRISDVISVHADLFEPVPENMDASARDLILGAFKLEEQLLLILDIHKTVGSRRGAAEVAA